MRPIKIDLRFIKVIFIGISLLLIFLSAEAYLRIRGINQTTARLFEHSTNRNLIIQSYNTFKDLETSSRGYALLGDSLLYNIRQSALGRLPNVLYQLKKNMGDWPVQDYYLDNLTSLYNNRLIELDDLLLTKDSALRSQILGNSAVVMEQCREQTERMLSEEERILADINLDLQKLLNTAPLSILSMIIFFIFILMLSYWSLIRQLQISKKLQKNLEDSNLSLEIANKSLFQSQAFLKSLLESNPNGIINYEAIRNKEGGIEDFRIIFASGNISVLGEKSPDDIIGKKASEIYPLLKSTDFYNHLINVVEKGQTEFFEFHYPFDGKIGGWYEIYLSKLNDGVTLNGRSINHIKLAEEELRKNIDLLHQRNREISYANEQLRQFTFIASHDLQEPLRKIKTFSNKLLDKIAADKTLESDVEKIRDSATRMSDLFSAISKYSRLQVEATNLQLVDLNKIAQQVINDLEIQIREKQAYIQIHKLPTINCDPQQISQLFLHLLSNSIKFCKRTPNIEVQCELVDDPLVLENLKHDYTYYRFRFIDNGIGFSNDYRDKLFVIFQRLHDDINFPGTGLGLALCQKIVENHKGTISAYSQENEGSTFDVYLPANLVSER